MLKNYLKIAFRNLRRQKGYAFINIAGLSVGLACSFFIVLWVVDEVSYDRFHEHCDDLYRVMQHVRLGDQTNTYATVPEPLADALEQEFSEAEHAMPLSWPDRLLLTHRNETYRERGYYADATFFQSFSFPLLVGDPASVISSPDAMAISPAGTKVLRFSPANVLAGELGHQRLLKMPGIEQVTTSNENPFDVDRCLRVQLRSL